MQQWQQMPEQQKRLAIVLAAVIVLALVLIVLMLLRRPAPTTQEVAQKPTVGAPTHGAGGQQAPGMFEEQMAAPERGCLQECWDKQVLQRHRWVDLRWVLLRVHLKQVPQHLLHRANWRTHLAPVAPTHLLICHLLVRSHHSLQSFCHRRQSLSF
jgi:hypothetical protein